MENRFRKWNVLSDVAHKADATRSSLMQNVFGRPSLCATVLWGLASLLPLWWPFPMAVGFSTEVQRVGVSGAVCLPTSQPDAWRENRKFLWTVSAQARLGPFHTPHPTTLAVLMGWSPGQQQRPEIRQHKKKKKNPCMEGNPVFLSHSPWIGKTCARDQLQGPQGAWHRSVLQFITINAFLSPPANKKGGKQPPLLLCPLGGTGPHSHSHPAWTSKPMNIHGRWSVPSVMVCSVP